MGAADGINPGLLSAFMQMQAAAAQAGFRLGIGSGYRTEAEQASLRRAHCCNDPGSSKCGCGPPTAPVGRSNHNHGLAIDIAGSGAAKAWANANGARFGLHFPVAGEDWHVELMGGGAGAGHMQGGQQMGAIGFDLNWLTEQRSPEEIMDEKVGSVMDLMVGAQRDAMTDSPLEAAGSELLESPTAPEIETPGLAQDFSAEQLAREQLPTSTVTIPGQPGAMPGGAAAGGEFKGNVPPSGYIPPGSGVERWRPIAIAALKYTGQSPTPDLVALMLRRMAQESGGDPRATNNWDSNAKRGDPSKGLMQNIGSAFPERARELANRGIYDGFANMVASIRYTLGRYGSLQRGWSRPGGY